MGNEACLFSGYVERVDAEFVRIRRVRWSVFEGEIIVKYINKNIVFGMSASAVVVSAMFAAAIANADGGFIPNSKCVTVVGAQTCADGGNSVCTAGVVGTTCTLMACSYCTSTIGYANKQCATWKSSTCTLTGAAVTHCGVGVPRMVGACQTVASVCICNNPVPTGTCTADDDYSFPCVN